MTETISDEQIPLFVDKCVNLLRLSGDGIDFDWEHLSSDPGIKNQQRSVLGKIIPALRQALNENGMPDKLIGYTTRFNAFWNDQTRPVGVTPFTSDGEGIDIATAMTQAGSSYNDSVNWVNIMMYDISPSDLGAVGALSLEQYKMVLGFFSQYIQKNKIVMGFEPGGQVSGGVWEGMAVDKQVIDYIKANDYGGVMFWAINQPASPPSTEVTGQNAQELARYANEKKLLNTAPTSLLLLLDDY